MTHNPLKIPKNQTADVMNVKANTLLHFMSWRPPLSLFLFQGVMQLPGYATNVISKRCNPRPQF